jgi:hypothetical protein
MSSPSMTPELRRMSLLRGFKIRTLRPGGEYLSPFTDRVATGYDDISRIDLTGLQGEVRNEIANQIAAVRTQQRSQVVLLSGEAGTGKSHILRYFAQPNVADEHGYFFIGGSNDWKVGEFKACLLDWMITALAARRHGTDSDPLLDRVRAIGFSVVGQLLKNRTPLRRCTAKFRRKVLGIPLGRRRATYEEIEKLHAAGDPKVFKLLDFSKFADEACVRFLAEPGNPVHCYAFKVLLTYLFADADDHGVGTRDRVLHWFRRKPDDGYWVNRLGVADDLAQLYQVADAIKLLVHLFSPDLSKRLSADGRPCPSRLFLCVFDQVEGRDELFDAESDWNHFFAHLSELYNTLPNVLIVFPMTLGLRNELHPKMERQFKDRIRKDERFVLRQPTPDQTREVYRSRLRAWLADEPIEQDTYAALPEVEQFLPFDGKRVEDIGGGRAVRAALEAFHEAFRNELRDGITIEPAYDFEYVRNEQLAIVESQGEHDYTADHLGTVRKLLVTLKEELAAASDGVRLTEIADEPTHGFKALRLEFADPTVPSAWFTLYLVRFGHYFGEYVSACREWLSGRQRAKYGVWMVRARAFEPKHDRPEQMFHRELPPSSEARLRAALHVLGKRDEYEKNGTWGDAWKLILGEIRASYLGEVLAQARDRVHALRTGALSDADDAPPEPAAAPGGAT